MLAGLPSFSLHFHLLLLLAMACSHSLASPATASALGDDIRKPARVLPRRGLEVVHQELEPVTPLLPVLRLPQRRVVVPDAARRGRRRARGAESAVRDLMPLAAQSLGRQEQVAVDGLASLGEPLLVQVRGGGGRSVADGRDHGAVARANGGKDRGAVAVRFFAERVREGRGPRKDGEAAAAHGVGPLLLPGEPALFDVGFYGATGFR